MRNMQLTFFFFAQCRICDNEGIGMICDESAVVSLVACILERNRRLAPKQVAMAKSDSHDRKKIDNSPSFPLILATRRQ